MQCSVRNEGKNKKDVKIHSNHTNYKLSNEKIPTCGATMILKDCWSFSANPKATNGKMS